MEPKLPAPNKGPELAPPQYNSGFEQAAPIFNPETNNERQNEQVEQRSQERSTPSAAPILPPPTIAPAPPLPADPKVVSPVNDDGLPLVANDDDLIEKEWVDKAKKIIDETKDDPYRREHEVSKLQADYLRKRYGRELGDTEQVV